MVCRSKAKARIVGAISLLILGTAAPLPSHAGGNELTFKQANGKSPLPIFDFARVTIKVPTGNRGDSLPPPPVGAGSPVAFVDGPGARSLPLPPSALKAQPQVAKTDSSQAIAAAIMQPQTAKQVPGVPEQSPTPVATNVSQPIAHDPVPAEIAHADTPPVTASVPPTSEPQPVSSQGPLPAGHKLAVSQTASDTHRPEQMISVIMASFVVGLSKERIAEVFGLSLVPLCGLIVARRRRLKQPVPTKVVRTYRPKSATNIASVAETVIFARNARLNYLKKQAALRTSM